jgi:ribosomal protein L7/L12
MLTKSIRKIFGIGLKQSKKLTEGENKFVIDGRQLTELRGELSDTGYYLKILDRRPKIG